MAIDTTGGAEVLTLTDVPRPARIGAELIVRVIAAGVNPIDAKTRGGRGVSAHIGRWPAVLGQDFSGIVEESPYEAHPLQPGAEVFGMTSVPRYGGSYAEYVAVSSLGVIRKPAALTHVEAAGVPLAALTAWGLVVDLAKAHQGQRMLVHAGAGGVGHFAVQFASYFGAHVVATGSPGNLRFLEQLGAAQVVDHTSTRFEEIATGMDVVVDLIGDVHDDTGSRSLRTLRRGGLILNVPTGSWPTFLDDAREAGMRASTFTVAPDGASLGIIARLLDAGNISVHVDEVYALEDAAAAHRALEGGHTRGKIVLRVAEG
jgi:NADPH:quinone reductase-like Zn-dependent oxidoreductase